MCLRIYAIEAIFYIMVSFCFFLYFVNKEWPNNHMSQQQQQQTSIGILTRKGQRMGMFISLLTMMQGLDSQGALGIYSWRVIVTLRDVFIICSLYTISLYVVGNVFIITSTSSNGRFWEFSKLELWFGSVPLAFVVICWFVLSLPAYILDDSTLRGVFILVAECWLLISCYVLIRAIFVVFRSIQDNNEERALNSSRIMQRYKSIVKMTMFVLLLTPTISYAMFMFLLFVFIDPGKLSPKVQTTVLNCTKFTPLHFELANLLMLIGLLLHNRFSTRSSIAAEKDRHYELKRESDQFRGTDKFNSSYNTSTNAKQSQLNQPLIDHKEDPVIS